MNLRPALALPIVALLAFISACGGTTTTVSDQEDSTTKTQSSALSIDQAWVKAADSEMSAAFGVLRNDSDKEIHITAATSSASPVMELHETVENASGEMVMREKEGGFVIPAGSEYVLEPGANHLMLMDIETPVKAGDDVSFSLTLQDGSTFEFTAPAKDFTGADERYIPGE